MSIAAEINTQPAQEWLSEQYLPFSLYAIRSRALVGTDGLKPVNRRILYSLYRKGVTADSKHLKACLVYTSPSPRDALRARLA